jgi:hypothetical protein
MQFIIPQSRNLNWKILMNRLGYHEHYDQRSQQTSYIRRLRSLNYPRYHVYLEMRGDDMRINIHLDEKQVSYEGQARHSGDYGSELVQREGERLKSYIVPHGE